MTWDGCLNYLLIYVVWLIPSPKATTMGAFVSVVCVQALVQIALNHFLSSEPQEYTFLIETKQSNYTIIIRLRPN